jgi:hypothetical protein
VCFGFWCPVKVSLAGLLVFVSETPKKWNFIVANAHDHNFQIAGSIKAPQRREISA